MLIENNENYILWSENIFNTIKYLSDLELQKLTWSGKHPEFVSSFTETLASLYDDLDFERFISYYQLIEGVDGSYKLMSELNELIKQFKEFGYETESNDNGYELILSNSNWIEITKKALKFVQINDKKNGGAKSQGGTSGNKINGVSADNKNAKKYDNAAQKEFGN